MLLAIATSHNNLPKQIDLESLYRTAAAHLKNI
ncbi:hypothetical protein S7335_416 [Synechococcus sp. PCC 7335]|nr:hypothetical protein S7335_416 [Synechococcus sp. PCC 7335]